MNAREHSILVGKQTQMKERRKFKRFDSSLPAQVEFVQAGRAQVQTAELRNISLGGAFIMLNGDTDPGTSIDLNIFDYENKFGRKLGVEINQEALNLKILDRVIRVENSDEENARQGVALEFTSPVRFAPLSRNGHQGIH